jgi:Ca2+-binding EF-hand superfamily protein
MDGWFDVIGHALQKLFAHVDQAGTGSITRKQFAAFLRKLGLTVHYTPNINNMH